MLTFCFWNRFKDKIVSNLIFKTKSNGIMFDQDFILGLMQYKTLSILGENATNESLFCGERMFV